MNNNFSTFLLYILFAVIITSFLRALFTYGYAVWKNSIKNSPTFLWHEAHQDEELYRNYFFGPWRHQIKLIYIECRDIIILEPTFTGTSWLQEKLGDIDISRLPVLSRFFLIIPMFWVWFFLYVYHFFERFFSLIFTAVLLMLFTVLHTIIAIPVSFAAKAVMNFKKANEIALRAQSGRAIRCTHCLEESTDCYFRCPQCQRVHQNLHPSRYGIWHTRCDCGYKLPLTHKGRQRNLSVHEVCPLCNNDLMFAMSKNFGVQLIGGSSAGKTTFLAAFWHEYINLLESFPYNSLRYYTVPSEKFDELEFLFKTGTSNATYERSAITYTVSHELPDSDTMLNFSLYDIAGEVFSNSTYERIQNQYTYCEGLIVLVDPLASLEFRQRSGFDDGELQGYSQSSPYIILSSFLETYKNLNRYRKNLVNTPLSIIITKSDIPAVNERIGLQVINEKYKAEEFTYGFQFDNARDTICKEFLFDVDFSDFLQLVDANFKNVHYFPVTAIGHTLNGEEYQPQGILDSVRWLFSDDLKKMVEKSLKAENTGERQSKKVEYVKPDYKPIEKPKPAPKVMTQAELEKEIAEEEAMFRQAYEKMQGVKKEEKPKKQYVDPDEFFGKKAPEPMPSVPEVPQFNKPKIVDNVIFFDEPLEDSDLVQEEFAPAKPKKQYNGNEILFDEPLEEYVPLQEEVVPEKPKKLYNDNEILFDEPLEEYVPPQEEVVPEKPQQKYNDNEILLDEPLEEYVVTVEAAEEDNLEELAEKYAKFYEENTESDIYSQGFIQKSDNVDDILSALNKD